MERIVHLFRDEGSDGAAVFKGANETVVRLLVQFLDSLTLDIGLTGQTQYVNEARMAHISSDDLGRQRELSHDGREFPGGRRLAGLFFNDMSGQRDGGMVHGISSR